MNGLRTLAHVFSPAMVVRLIVGAECVALVLTVVAERALRLKVGAGFGEHGPATLISFVQLLTVGVLAMTILYLRVDELRSAKWRGPIAVWVPIGLGFFFLALDEVLRIHERTDRLIHRVFSIQETPWTDRFDDLQIAVYLAVGLLIIVFYKSEFTRHRWVHPLACAGLGFAALSIALDLLTNGGALFPETISPWLGGLVEEGSKVLAEGFFISIAYYYVHCALKERH